MDYDQTYSQGAEQWSFPSPTATPTSGTVNNGATVCHTPKTAGYTSYFQDAFNTPQIPGFTTPVQPEHPSMTPMQRSQMSAEALNANYFAHAQAYGDRNHEQGQFMPAQHTGLFPVGGPIPTLPSNAPPLGSQAAAAAAAMSFDSSHMQTPPPTRGASNKKNDSAQPVAFGTPSTIHSRRFASPQQQVMPQQPISALQHTNMQFPHQSLAPNAYPFQNFGPASTPVFPQSQFLWTSPNLYQEANSLGDAFAASMSGNTPWLSPSPHLTRNVQAVNFETPAMKSFSTQEPHPRPAPAVPSSVTTLQPSAFQSGSVDPSLVYTSPMRPLIQPKSRATKARARASQEMLRTRSSAVADHARSETVSSVGSSSSVSSRGLRRNNTTGTADLARAQDSLRASEASFRNSALQIPRTASPQKRVGQSVLGSITESKKLRSQPSVVLTIDETGRARTETRLAEDSPTRALRERYPGLYESDSSDAETEADEEPLSCNASFSFSRGEERSAKAARLDPPLENLIGLSIPRSSSATSSVSPSKAAVAATVQLRRDSSRRKRTSSRNSQKRTIKSANTSFDQASMQLDTTSSFAFSASGSLPRSATVSFEQRRSNVSFASKSTANRTFFGEVDQQELLIRCGCGFGTQNGHTVIQCHSCKKWQHRACEGIHANVLPPKYSCSFCKAAPSTRAQKAKGR